MKNPNAFLVHNLRFTRTGQVWADFLLQGINYGLKAPKDKEEVRLLHKALIRSLPGESLLLGVASGLDPDRVVDQMMDGVDAAVCPQWWDECVATRDSLELLRPGQRIYWLSVPLPDGTGGVQLKFAAAKRVVEESLGLPAAAPSPAVVEKYRDKARQVMNGLPGVFRPVPATPAQMVWLHQHMVDRGLYQDPVVPQPEQRTAPKRGSALDPVLLDEGGQSDAGKREVRSPLKHRYVKVQSAESLDDSEASYQSLMVLSDVPDGEIPFPGGEVLGRIDETALPVDFAVRFTVRAAAEVLRRNQRALETLNEQFKQRDGEVSLGVSVLDRTADALTEYAATLEADKLEVEVQATMFLAVAAPTPEPALEQAQALATWFRDIGYKVSQPLGYQTEMWWQMQPAVASSPVTRQYAQITTSDAFAAMVPMASSHLGDRSGTLLGININNGPLLDAHTTWGPSSVVFHDPEGATDRQVSGSFAVVGELGSGKSFLLKKAAGAVLDRGGQLVINDRTAVGEYVQWATSLIDPQIVDVGDPCWSLDPLRVFGPLTGSRVAQSFLTPLLNVPPTSPQGVLLSEVLDPSYLSAHRIGSLGELVSHLSEGCQVEGASEMARLMGVFARKDLGRVIFDPHIRPLDVTASALVFRTHGLQLPKRDELDKEHLFRQLSLEKIFGRAMFALIASIARLVCFADTERLGVFLVDEAHAVTSSPEGTAELLDHIRDGRKHRASLLLGSHDPVEDFPSDALRGLIPFRILMRHRDRTLAQNGLKWLGLDPDDDTLVELITHNTSPELGGQIPDYRRGECLIRDAAGNIGRVKILPPALKARDQAARTGGAKDVAA